uniref:Uncharacterized protein n=1 Tax=Anthoceros angustus TaxID=48387 RepID=A0A2P1L4X1_ANTAG|nr:hypothetical protein AnanMp33 [Anthoceros angustus]AVP12856.1 hypothetical protein AnanMp33 [Anthoceros angustus]
MQNWFRGLRPLDTYPNLPEPNRTYLWEFLNHLANSQDTLVKLAEIGVFIEREADRNSGNTWTHIPTRNLKCRGNLIPLLPFRSRLDIHQRRVNRRPEKRIDENIAADSYI